MVDFRIIQLTDLHIGDEDEYPFGVNLRTNLLQTLGEVERMNPNLIVLTGDFCYKDPKPEIYYWIRQQLDKLGIPFEVIGGNHDDTAQMTTGLVGEDLSNEQGEYYFSDIILNHNILYLDSGKGSLSAPQLDWLRLESRHAAGQPLIVFMHHPPLLAGVPHMDRRYFLDNREELMQVFRDHDGLVQVFCGHYHVDRCVTVANVIVHITPSLFMQIFPYTQEFAIDHYQIGYRVIDFVDDEVRHEVRYLPGNRF